MDVLMIKEGIIRTVSSVNSIEELQTCYPDMLLIERTGEEWEGWSYDGVKFHPPVGYVQPNPTKITKLAFLNRFTDAEAVRIDLASMGATTEAATLRRELKRIDAADHIDLTNDKLISGLALLEGAGLLASGRATEIMNTPVAEHEVFGK
jgi:hypothetical protein